MRSARTATPGPSSSSNATERPAVAMSSASSDTRISFPVPHAQLFSLDTSRKPLARSRPKARPRLPIGCRPKVRTPLHPVLWNHSSKSQCTADVLLVDHDFTALDLGKPTASPIKGLSGFRGSRFEPGNQRVFRTGGKPADQGSVLLLVMDVGCRVHDDVAHGPSFAQ
jgi:hypothetical protein